MIHDKATPSPGVLSHKDQDTAFDDQTVYSSEIAFRQFELAGALERLIDEWKHTKPEKSATPQRSSGASWMLSCGAAGARPGCPARVGRALEIEAPQFVCFAGQEALNARGDTPGQQTDRKNKSKGSSCNENNAELRDAFAKMFQDAVNPSGTPKQIPISKTLGYLNVNMLTMFKQDNPYPLQTRSSPWH